MGYDLRAGEREVPTARAATQAAQDKPALKAWRYWEVDAARGVALLMMVVYHTAYDLYAFGGYQISATSGLWARFSDLTAATFLFLVGVSLAISHERDLRAGRATFGKYLLRGLRIFGCGLLLTAVFLAFDLGYVLFGILHLIGVSIILAYPLLRFEKLNLALGLAVFALGLYVMRLDIHPASGWLLPFGLVPENLPMPDYRPLLPWFGIVLVGLSFGNLVYGSGKRESRPPERRKAPLLARPLLPLGRHSLLFYLVHQPVIIVLLSAAGVISGVL